MNDVILNPIPVEQRMAEHESNMRDAAVVVNVLRAVTRLTAEYIKYLKTTSLSETLLPSTYSIVRTLTPNYVKHRIFYDWLSFEVYVNHDGTIYYDMPILDIKYGKLEELLRARFSHLHDCETPVAFEDVICKLNKFESKLVECCVLLLEYNERQKQIE